MASAASIPFISVEDYLHSTYQPDLDYIDGVLEERNTGEFDHGDLQWAVLEALNVFTPSLGIRARPAVRVQVSPTRFRVPDVCVLPAAWRRTQIVQQPPLLCVEVLSPGDRLAEVTQRSRDYLEMGVPEVWILDPRSRTCTVFSDSNSQEHSVGRLAIPGAQASVDLAGLFRVLDF